MKRHLLRPAARNLSRALVLAAAASLALTTIPARATAPDLDSDGIPNVVDPDVDNDGIPNALDKNVDGGIAKSGPRAGQYIGDRLDNDNPADKDIDGDSLSDDSLGEKDIDGDSKTDDSSTETDVDGDRRNDESSSEKDIDGDGIDDDSADEDDIDGDGLDDDDDIETDIDGDGKSDDDDDDVDGDGRRNSDASEDDTDGDGRRNDDADEDNDDGDSRRDRDDADDDNDGDSDEDDLDHRQEDDELEVQISLSGTEAAPKGSRARVKIQRMASGKIELEVDARDLDAGAYEVVVDGTVLGTLAMERDGKRTEGEQEFETNPNKSDELPLLIDPAGLPISLRKAGVVYYTGIVPNTPTPTPDKLITGAGTTVLARSAEAPAGSRAEATVEFGPTGADELEVEVHLLPVGEYQVLIGEAVRGTLTIGTGVTSRASIKFDTEPNDPGEILLDFPVGGSPIAIVSGTTTFFFGTLPASPTLPNDPGNPGNPGNPATPDDNGGGLPVQTALTPAAGVPAEASSTIEIQFGIAGPVGFEVEVERLPAGNYELVVGGTPRGVLVLAATDNGVRGKLRFEAVPNKAGEVLLDFVPSGESVVIKQGETVFFSGTVPTQG
jgi:hypothetical protein